MATVQRTYTKEFKEEAVRLLETTGKSAAQLARELGISDSALYHWRQQFSIQGEHAFPGKGHQTSPEEELRHIRRELEVVKQERDILKKAVSIFSQGAR